MKFIIRFKIGNRFGVGSKYSLTEFCANVIARYGLRENEVCTIVTLQVGETFTNSVLTAKRVA
jgi:hypothetical protein